MRRTELRRKTPLLSRFKPTGPARDVVDAVLERSMHSCECCSAAVGDKRGTDYHVHHRRPRAAGGSRRADTNLPSNLLLLCPTCHDGIESNRALAQSVGWLVPQIADPADVAVLIGRERWVYLTDSGTYSNYPPKGVVR